MAGIVYEGVRNTTGDGRKLFDGLSFWFSSAVPQRIWLLENAVANGATIVPLEKQADVLIVDHARKNAPVGTHSYKYIEQSIRNGTLEDLADYVVGPSKSTERPVGSIITAPKGSRSKYTEAEDQLLWNFIKPYELRGGATGGNEIYKQLEEAHGNGRHTYQSWRDRWLKHVKFQNRQITDHVHTAENDEEDSEATQQVAHASPSRRVLATPPKSSPHRAMAVTSRKAPIDNPQGSRTVPASSEDLATIHYRAALQRKLGRILPSVPSSSNLRDWEQVPDWKRPENIARTEPFQLHRQQAGLGTHVPAEEGVREDPSTQPSQSTPEGPERIDRPDQSSQASGDYFTDDEYNLLMDAAEFMIRAGDDDDESWEQMGEKYPRHSSESWREFWEEKVKPDYLNTLVQIKEERVSSGDAERLESDVLREVAKYPGSSIQEGEVLDDGEENVVEEDNHQQVAEEVQHDDGLESLFGTPNPVTTKGSSPFMCRWLGCNMDVHSMSKLLEHVSSKHKPGARDPMFINPAYPCRWKGCSKVRVDEHGIITTLDLRKPGVWVEHFIKEHINAIQVKDGLRPSYSERGRNEYETRTTTQASVEAKAGGSDSPTAHVVLVSPRPESPRQITKTVQLDGSSKDDKQEEEAVDDTSEEAEETDGSSSSEDLGKEVLSLSSNEDDHDRRSSTSPRRSRRLRNAPRFRMREPTVFNYVDTAVGSSPPLPIEDTPPRVANSPAIRHLSRSPSKPPEPNEARKRSAGKGNSQESNQSLNHTQEVADLHGAKISQQQVIPSPRKRTREPEQEPEISRQESPDLPVRSNFEPQVKRRKQRHDEEEPLEIPSTPEHRTVLGELFLEDDDDDRGSSMLGGSPTPRPRARFGSGDGLLHSTTPHSTTPQSAGFEAEEHQLTSPLHISLLSDADNRLAPSSPAKSDSTRQEELSSEADLEFETAPQSVGNLWVTAPSEEPDEEDAEEETQYEIAPEPKGKGRESFDTQSLFAQSIPHIDDEEDPFALPEPEGGWPDDVDAIDLGRPLEELMAPTSHQPERIDNEDEEDDDVASIPDVPSWVDEVTAEDDSIDVETLLHAIHATSGFDEKLTREVHDFMRARQAQGSSDVLPMHWKGCWTQGDDDALRKGDAREKIRILKKHERSSVERRGTWLEAIEGG